MVAVGVVAERRKQLRLGARALRHHRLIRALAAKVAQCIDSKRSLTGKRQAIDTKHQVDRRITDNANTRFIHSRLASQDSWSIAAHCLPRRRTLAAASDSTYRSSTQACVHGRAYPRLTVGGRSREPSRSALHPLSTALRYSPASEATAFQVPRRSGAKRPRSR